MNERLMDLDALEVLVEKGFSLEEAIGKFKDHTVVSILRDDRISWETAINISRIESLEQKIRVMATETAGENAFDACQFAETALALSNAERGNSAPHVISAIEGLLGKAIGAMSWRGAGLDVAKQCHLILDARPLDIDPAIYRAILNKEIKLAKKREAELKEIKDALAKSR